MKTFHKIWFLAIFCSLSLLSCKKNCDEHCMSSKTGLKMSGAQEVPATSTKASGTLDVSYNKCDRTLSFRAQWKKLSDIPVAAHIHGTAPKGVNAGVVFPFSDMIPKTTSGSYETTLKIDDYNINEADLLKGMYYVNIHSANFPAGEIRAQIEFH